MTPHNKTFKNLFIFSGTSCPDLSNNICKYLGIHLGEINISKFPNDNYFVQIKDNIRGKDVFIIQTAAFPVNEFIMEFLVMVDAIRRASPRRITAVIPYFPYARSDKKDQPRVPVTSKMIANLIVASGVHRVITIDLHSDQIQGFFDIPLDHLSARPLFIKYFREMDLSNSIVLAADSGDLLRARAVAQILNLPVAFIDKRREFDSHNPKAYNVIGNVEGKDILFIDDEIVTAGTIVRGLEALYQNPVGKVHIACTHAVLPVLGRERMDNARYDSLIITDTVPMTIDRQPKKTKVVTVSRLLAEAIKRTHLETSVGELLREDSLWDLL